MQSHYCNPRKSPPEPPKGTLSTSIIPTAIADLPIPSDTDIFHFSDTSGTKQRTPTVGCASLRITWHADGPNVEHRTGATFFWASSHGELRPRLPTTAAQHRRSPARQPVAGPHPPSCY